MDISGTTHPNLASDSPWLTQPWGHILILIESSHQPSHLSIYILFFPWWVTVFSFITHFPSDLSTDSSCCSEMELYIPLTHRWAITYRSQKCCLVMIPSCIYRDCFASQSDSGLLFSAFFSKVLSLTVLITASRFVITLIKVWTTLIMSSECVHITSAVLHQHKVSKIKHIFQEICWIFLTLTLKSSPCFVFSFQI